MSRIAYLSMDSLADFECYDTLTFPFLQALGHEVAEVSWRHERDWDAYDYVIIRSPWDYQDDAEAFLSVLGAIEASSATLLNPLSIVRWNINKRYLAELEASGTAIVPTQWSTDLTVDEVNRACADFGTGEIIVKPAVSANADDTFRIPSSDLEGFIAKNLPRFRKRDCMIQPFLSAVVDEGEFSLFYFGGDLSHCILKTPKAQDFRVQEEHGGQLNLVRNPEDALIAAGGQVLECIDTPLLYARLDFVRDPTGFLLMEAELIEPSLYFNLDPDSPERFAQTLHRWIGDRS